MEMKTEDVAPRIRVVAVQGRVDAVTAPQLERAVKEALSSPSSGCILNLSGVDYMSSAGIRALVLGSKAARSTGGSFSVCVLQDGVRKVLETVGFLPLLDVFADQATAVVAVRKKLGA